VITAAPTVLILDGDLASRVDLTKLRLMDPDQAALRASYRRPAIWASGSCGQAKAAMTGWIARAALVWIDLNPRPNGRQHTLAGDAAGDVLTRGVGPRQLCLPSGLPGLAFLSQP